MQYIPFIGFGLIIIALIALGISQYKKGKLENFDKKDY
jgi:hypothetical protein